MLSEFNAYTETEMIKTKCVNMWNTANMCSQTLTMYIKLTINETIHMYIKSQARIFTSNCQKVINVHQSNGDIII